MENLTSPLRLLLLSFCCCELLNEQKAKNTSAFSAKEALISFFLFVCFSGVYCVFGAGFISAPKMS